MLAATAETAAADHGDDGDEDAGGAGHDVDDNNDNRGDGGDNDSGDNSDRDVGGDGQDVGPLPFWLKPLVQRVLAAWRPHPDGGPMPLVQEVRHPKSLDFWNEKKVVIARDVRGCTWEEVAASVVNLQGEQPSVSIVKRIYANLSTRTGRRTLGYKRCGWKPWKCTKGRRRPRRRRQRRPRRSRRRRRRRQRRQR